MRVLVISDIHANLQALEAVLQAAPSWDQVWNLGDIVGYGANPNEVAQKAQSLGGAIVRGNHDRACAGLADLEDFSDAAADAARWTQSILTAGNRSWLAGLPRGPIQRADLPVQLVHGSPLDEDEYIVSGNEAQAVLHAAGHAAGAKMTFFGHTHVQLGFATNGDEDFRLAPLYSSASVAESFELPLRRGAHYLLNPGSVGQPRDGDWRAAFGLFDDSREVFAWHRVPYDVAEAQRRIRRAGLPEFLAARLAKGQ
ncbi:MAG TPA: metallophosphoesterase family protein [Terracidiphilus sp.]|nr:metallophosphoesterase family protein [Terracidiphilus sp.]